MINRYALTGVLGTAIPALLVFAAAHAQSPTPVTERVWQEAVVSVHDLDRSARFFLDIGGYEVKWRGSLSTDAIVQLFQPFDDRE